MPQKPVRRQPPKLFVPPPPMGAGRRATPPPLPMSSPPPVSDYAQPTIVRQSQALAQILGELQRRATPPPPLPPRRVRRPIAVPPVARPGAAPPSTGGLLPISPAPTALPVATGPTLRRQANAGVSIDRLDAASLAQMLRPALLRSQMIFNEAIRPPLALREIGDE